MNQAKSCEPGLQIRQRAFSDFLNGNHIGTSSVQRTKLVRNAPDPAVEVPGDDFHLCRFHFGI
jgi:hypothetical protein